MSDRCRCAHPEVLADVSAANRWPEGTELTWWLDATMIPSTLGTAQDVSAALAGAFAAHARACNVQIREVSFRDQARLLIGFQPIDGPYNVLAQTQLPYAGIDPGSQLWMHLDSAEQWTLKFVGQVAMHEFGHFLGVGHAPAPILAVMSPEYQPQFSDLQPWDVAQDQARYGPAAPAAAAPPSAAAPSETIVMDPITLRITVPGPGTYEVVCTPTSAKRVTP